MPYVPLTAVDLQPNKPARATSFALRVHNNFEDHEARIVDLETDVADLESIGLRASVITLTNAQILALPTTRFPLVPAPSGFIVQPVQIDLYGRFPSGEYTNVDDAAELFASLESDEIQSTRVRQLGPSGEISTFFGPVRSHTTLVPRYLAPSGFIDMVDAKVDVIVGADDESLELVLENGGSGNLTGGHASNTLRVRTLYTLEASS